MNKQVASERVHQLRERYHDIVGESSIPKYILLIVMLYLLVAVILGIIWSFEPKPFDVQEYTNQRALELNQKPVVGYATTAATIGIAETLLDKRGGYLSNDLFPPGIWLDNMPNWEFGALIQIRDMTRALRESFSRSQSQSKEDPDLSEAEPKFVFTNDRWILPSTESEYRNGIEYLERYLQRLGQVETTDAQFYARADNLNYWLSIVSSRLGSLSQRLSASVGQTRLNTDLAGEPSASQSTTAPKEIVTKTSWFELDDNFYEARGTTWALIQLLYAIEIDFEDVLKKKNALVSVQQIIRELEATQEPIRSPLILNGSGFGMTANHSLVMASYISRANAAIIDLRDLLSKG